MTYHFPAKTYASASEMLAAGKACRDRLMSAPAPARQIKPRQWSYAPAPLPLLPSTEAELTYSPGQAHWRLILVEVAAKHGLTVGDIQSAARFRHFVAARHEAAFRMAVETELSYPQIGQRMGGRDHSTAINSIKKFARLFGLPLPRNLGVAA